MIFNFAGQIICDTFLLFFQELLVVLTLEVIHINALKIQTLILFLQIAHHQINRFLQGSLFDFSSLQNDIQVAILKRTVFWLEDCLGSISENRSKILFALLALRFTIDDQLAPLEFYSLSLNNLFLYGVLGNKTINVHRIFLPDSVGSVHGLKIYLRVPVRVEQNHSVRSH